MPEIHSTGRGGAGNIGEDSTVYTDGSIVREGQQGVSATSTEYSTGRGGAGNIDGKLKPANGSASGSASGSAPHSPAVKATRRTDEDVVPEPAMHSNPYSNFHTGRGGQGNVYKEKYGGHSKPQDPDHLVKEHGKTEDEAQAQKKHHLGVGEKVKSLLSGKH